MTEPAGSAGNPRRYSFSPLEKRGILLGLQPAQLIALVMGLLASMVAGGVAPGAARVPVVLGLLAGTAATALVPVSGRPILGWVPLVAGWLVRRAASPRFSAEPQVGRVPGADAGPLRRPARGKASLTPGVWWRPLPAQPGGAEIGIWQDPRYGTLGAIVPVKGRSFALLDEDKQVQRLEAWQAVLGVLGRPGSPLRRVQWLEKSAPEGCLPLPLPAAGSSAARAAEGRARDSYRSLVDRAGPATQAHDVWMILAVAGTRPSRADATKAVDALRRELRLLAGHARRADLLAGDPLRGEEIASLIGSPTAVDEEWSVLHVDGEWHATYWVAEWPRVEVPPDFLSPLLVAEGRRSVSVVMAPVPAARAVREARSARTADHADAELRSRAGFLPSARREREADGAVRRESELAEGHSEYRFSGYVTVTAGDRAQLEVACAETEHAAQAAHLELRRLYGRQAEAFTWTLPLARGLT